MKSENTQKLESWKQDQIDSELIELKNILKEVILKPYVIYVRHHGFKNSFLITNLKLN